jgi:hypothetical protein
MNCTVVAKYYIPVQMEEDEMGRECRTHGLDMKCKVNVTPRHAYAGTEGMQLCSSNPFAASALEEAEWSVSRNMKCSVCKI